MLLHPCKIVLNCSSRELDLAQLSCGECEGVFLPFPKTSLEFSFLTIQGNSFISVPFCIKTYERLSVDSNLLTKYLPCCFEACKDEGATTIKLIILNNPLKGRNTKVILSQVISFFYKIRLRGRRRNMCDDITTQIMFTKGSGDEQ